MEQSAASGPAPRLRRAAASDAEDVRVLVSDAYSHYIPLIGRTPIPMLADYADVIGTHEVWVLEDDGTIVGVLELDPRPDYLWLENVAVEPSRQGRGFGRILLALAERVARDRELCEIRLLTNERYLDNIAMYERHGYVETHRRPHLGTDLVFFAKPIDLDGRS